MAVMVDVGALRVDITRLKYGGFHACYSLTNETKDGGRGADGGQ